MVRGVELYVIKLVNFLAISFSFSLLVEGVFSLWTDE